MKRRWNFAGLISFKFVLFGLAAICSLQVGASEVVGGSDAGAASGAANSGLRVSEDKVYELRPFGDGEACFSLSGILQTTKDNCRLQKDDSTAGAKIVAKCLSASMTADLYGNCQASGRKSLDEAVRKCAGTEVLSANEKSYKRSVAHFCSQSAGVGNCSDQGGGQYMCSTSGSYYGSRSDCEDSCP